MLKSLKKKARLKLLDLATKMNKNMGTAGICYILSLLAEGQFSKKIVFWTTVIRNISDGYAWALVFTWNAVL